MKYIKDLRVKRASTPTLSELEHIGFQATKIAEAAQVIKSSSTQECTKFLSFTANMMASGLRGVLTQLVEEGYIDAVITTGGSIDHDIIRSYRKYILGDFEADDIKLNKNHMNRIGNILVPTDHYIFLEKKMRRFYGDMKKQQRIFGPSQLIKHIGGKLPKGSFLHQCAKRDIPVFCPGFVDSACGMHLFFYRQDNPELILSPAEDLKILSDIIFSAKKTSGIVLGGGISKHHLIGSNLLRGGLDMAVYVTTASEYDGSLSGARPKEAKSWGKIRNKASTVSVTADASIALPQIVSYLI